MTLSLCLVEMYGLFQFPSFFEKRIPWSCVDLTKFKDEKLKAKFFRTASENKVYENPTILILLYHQTLLDQDKRQEKEKKQVYRWGKKML